LRSPRSLIQTIGRAARNVRGEVIMYADRITAAMKQAMEETDRRRAKQQAYNVEHNITPATIVRAIHDMSPTSGSRDYLNVAKTKIDVDAMPADIDKAELIEALRQEMFTAAENLDFEKAAKIRDQLKRLRGESDVQEIMSARPAKAASSGRAGGAKRGGGMGGRGRRR
jgi:excinuclease ABC subunit B